MILLPGSSRQARDAADESSEMADGYVRQIAEAMTMDNDGRSVTRAAAWQHGVTVRLHK